jgi:murein DD-endopeptidase MepM/ murein hydrolase activator NlpD
MTIYSSKELVHMQTTGTKRHSRILLPLLLSILLMFTAFMLPLNQVRAYAVTSAEKQAEADEMSSKLDALQTELNQATENYNNAIAAHEAAVQRMNDAQARKQAAEQRITELQSELSGRATQMYRGGQSSFLDVLFGAKSFMEFVTAWDLMNRVNEKDAQMVADTKILRDTAAAAEAEFTTQAQIAAEQEEKARVAKLEMETTIASMQTQIAQLNEEIAELMAKEEEARIQAEEAKRRAIIEESNIDPADLERVPVLTHPCPGAVVSSGFGYRSFDNSHHNGLDLAAPSGTPILAAASGTVIVAGWGGSAGNWVIITHGNGVRTIYMHASAIYASAGQQVSAGDTIAAVGNTGNSFGAHLHFQIEINGKPVNPQLFL